MDKAIFAVTLLSSSSWLYIRTRRLETERRLQAFREKNYEELARGYDVLGMEFQICDKSRLTCNAIFTEDLKALEAINSNDVKMLYYIARTDFAVECCEKLPELFPPKEVLKLAIEHNRTKLIEKLERMSPNEASN